MIVTGVAVIKLNNLQMTTPPMGVLMQHNTLNNRVVPPQYQLQAWIKEKDDGKSLCCYKPGCHGFWFENWVCRWSWSENWVCRGLLFETGCVVGSCLKTGCVVGSCLKLGVSGCWFETGCVVGSCLKLGVPWVLV